MSKHSEHGSTKSYVVGFILSLIFTLVPYYLVVNMTLAGTTLWVAILGIAVLQMAIQLLFFLHLGRGPKPLYNIVFFFATAGVIVITVGASLFIMNNLYRNMSPEESTRRLAQKENIAQIGGEETGACAQNKNSYIITIQDGMADPNLVEAERCDTLTFFNKDSETRVIRFGVYPAQESYGGEFEVVLDDARPETITLNQEGEFMFYDERDLGVSGSFNVE